VKITKIDAALIYSQAHAVQSFSGALPQGNSEFRKKSSLQAHTAHKKALRGFPDIIDRVVINGDAVGRIAVSEPFELPDVEGF
jgi:hypothetical protein